ncbi:MAG: Relaxase/Mobilization nuclease protein [Mucilaginibacter sp.]|nr:Relaxase/Mobilization nuclease protein [Mucilaginibacter sp.]
MVARISTPSKVAKALNYNEYKVGEGMAELIWTAGYLKDMEQLNFYEKLEGFQRLIDLNNSKTNSLHISLNFAESDVLDRGKLIQLADDYLARIGFGEQPYLVYQHFDAGHPHVHVVTCSIREDGSRIDTYKIGERLSKPATIELEQLYGLIVADKKQQREVFRQAPINAQKVAYGKVPTRRAISNVLLSVLDKYHYTSLPELNALLRLYNVTADRGSPDSQTYLNNGLVYRVLDEKGNKIGVPIKASSLHGQPTLKNLTEKFVANGQPKQKEKIKLRTAIDLALHQQVTLDRLVAILKRQGIDVVMHRSVKGEIFGMTFIDHTTKCVFKGSDLGKDYGAKAIQERCILRVSKQQQLAPDITGLTDALQEGRPEQMDWQLKRSRKKKKRQNLGG